MNFFARLLAGLKGLGVDIVNATLDWTFGGNVDIPEGKEYRIDGRDIYYAPIIDEHGHWVIDEAENLVRSEY